MSVRSFASVLVAVVFLAMIAGDFTQDGLTADDALLAIIAAYILFLLWMFYAERWGMPLGTRKAFRQQKALQGKLVVDWSPDGLTITSAKGRWTAPWQDYVAWTEDDAVLIALQTDRLFNLVPKRVLEASDLVDIRSYLAAAQVKRR